MKKINKSIFVNVDTDVIGGHKLAYSSIKVTNCPFEPIVFKYSNEDEKGKLSCDSFELVFDLPVNFQFSKGSSIKKGLRAKSKSGDWLARRPKYGLTRKSRQLYINADDREWIVKPFGSRFVGLYRNDNLIAYFGLLGGYILKNADELDTQAFCWSMFIDFPNLVKNPVTRLSSILLGWDTCHIW